MLQSNSAPNDFKATRAPVRVVVGVVVLLRRQNVHSRCASVLVARCALAEIRVRCYRRLRGGGHGAALRVCRAVSSGAPLSRTRSCERMQRDQDDPQAASNLQGRDVEDAVEEFKKAPLPVLSTAGNFKIQIRGGGGGGAQVAVTPVSSANTAVLSFESFAGAGAKASGDNSLVLEGFFGGNADDGGAAVIDDEPILPNQPPESVVSPPAAAAAARASTSPTAGSARASSAHAHSRSPANAPHAV